MKLLAQVRRPFVLAALLLALVLSSALLPSPGGGVNATSAYPRYEKEIIYYSDASLTTQVGTGHIYCNGRGTLDGTSSPYYTEEILNVCCGSLAC